GGAATITLPFWPGTLSASGMMFGAYMLLRIFIVVFASQWIRRVGEPGDFVRGMRRLGLPQTLSQVLDVTLALLEGSDGPGMGGGRGGGDGRNRHGNKDGASESSAQGRNKISLHALIKRGTESLQNAARSAMRRAGQHHSKDQK